MATETVTLTYTREGKTFTATTTVTDPVVSPAGFPDASTTGARGTLAAYSGRADLRTDNAVYTNLIFSDQIEVYGKNVTFRNCKFTCQSFWPLRMYGGGLIDHCTFVNGSQSQCSVHLGDATTIQFCDLTGAGDGIRGVDGCIITDNFVHPTGPADAHRDGIDVEGTEGNNVIRHNRVEVYSLQTSCLTLENDVGSGKWDNNLVENNFFAGGGYIFYFVSRVPITNLRVLNNTFSKKFFPKYGGQPDAQGQALVYEKFGSGATNVWSGNVDADSGVTVPKP